MREDWPLRHVVLCAGAGVNRCLYSLWDSLVVERTQAWLSKCRAILVRWDKQAGNYLGLLKLACALLWYRRYRRLAARR